MPAGHYCSGGGELIGQIEEAARRIPPGWRHSLCMYGVGNHGGGPTKENIASIHACAADATKPKAVMSSTAQFFAAIADKLNALPVVQGDLQHHAPGCYTAHSEIKRLNRRCEEALMQAEFFAGLAALYAERPAPTGEFERAWRNVLFNQFHDILAGTSVPEAYDDARIFAGESLTIAQRTENAALQALAACVDTSGPGRPLLLFNPLPRPRRETVEVQWNGDWGGDGSGMLVDADGKEVLFQPAPPTMFPAAERITFVADLPAAGCHCYRWIASGTSAGALPDDETAPRAGEHCLENSHWRLDFDRATGYLTRLFDKDSGAIVIDGPACVPLVIDDPADTWAHGWLRFDNEAGRFGDPRFTVTESGPVRATLRIDQRWGSSTLRQEFSLSREDRRIDIRLTIDWHEQHRMLKYSVPAAFSAPELTAEVPGGTLVRDTDGAEDPCYRWIALTGETQREGGRKLRYTLALLNDSKYGYSCHGADLRLSLLRSPIACFHDPAKVEPGREYTFLDQGVQVVRLVLVAQAGVWQKADLSAAANALHHPPVPVFQYPHGGAWPGRREFLRVEPHHVLVLALKGAEADGGVILRLFETAGTPARAKVTIGDWRFTTALGGHEIKTLRLDAASRRVQTVDLLEEAET